MATDNNTFVNSFVTGIDSDSSLDRVKTPVTQRLRILGCYHSILQTNMDPLNL